MPDNLRVMPTYNVHPGTLSFPVTPVIPPNVSTGDVITSAHENQVSKALADLWTNVQTCVVTSGSYANPAWITSLDAAKLTGTPPAAVISATQTPWLQDIDGAAFTLKNVGKVGIGTASPLAPLHVQRSPYDFMAADYTVDIGVGGISSTWVRAFRVVNTTNSNGRDGGTFGVFGTGATPNYVYMAIPTADLTGYDSTKIICLNNGGNVGIGTASPGTVLDVVGPAASSVIRASASANPTISVRETTANSLAQMSVASGTDAFLTGAHVNDMLLYSSNGGLALGTGNVARVYVTSGGNVGVGTVSPSDTLDVACTTYAASATGGIGLWTKDGVSVKTSMRLIADSGGAFRLGLGSDACNVYSARECISILMQSGNVGIGTTGPTATLDVQGTVAFHGLPTSAPAAGSKQVWADPADSYRLKLAN